ncbi:hypothetical protein N7539_006327 [Penicillium diatomitis]|uniref:Ubiquinone biosynthesis protein n=1 Tax=Penicillium diatomitis TaxID=2819901 RepID=A0A9W9X2Y4_9EURO|nr:uncharacterized protein N7539_006327 [Penicillium diatomitis]KAJ5482881.1 hypothetical protein N7539_006327 [Penicillium diatomitis]
MASLPRLHRARTSLSAIPSLRTSHQPGAVAPYHAPANSLSTSLSTSTSTARSSPISSSCLISNSATISQAQTRTPTPLCIRARARSHLHAQPQIQSALHPSIRTYHSSLHPRPPTHEYTNSQVAILSASLAHIPTEGFTRAALTAGARDAGFLDVSVQLLPRGEFDLVLFWLASRRGLLRAKVEDGCVFGETAGTPAGDRTGTGKGKGSGLSVDEKVRILIMERLRMNKDVKGVWQDALAQMSLLGNIPLAFSELHALSNDILNLAGDTAVDSTWYARRMAIGAIYASAEMAMTRDPTPDMVETEAFVKRRFEDKQALKDKVEGVGSWVGFWGNTVVGVGRSWGLKI